MNTQHTAEPYSISGIPGDNHIMARVGDELKTVAIIPGWFGISPEEHEANKRLCAAAPKLLAAMENLLNTRCFRNDLSPEHLAALDQCRAAIAQVKGQP